MPEPGVDRNIARIEKAEDYLEGLANTIDDTLDDDSVGWSHELRSVAAELRAVMLSLGLQQAGAVAKIARLEAELASIADADPVDLALDSTWPQRVARDALGRPRGQ